MGSGAPKFSTPRDVVAIMINPGSASARARAIYFAWFILVQRRKRAIAPALRVRCGQGACARCGAMAMAAAGGRVGVRRCWGGCPGVWGGWLGGRPPPLRPPGGAGRRFLMEFGCRRTDRQIDFDQSPNSQIANFPSQIEFARVCGPRYG